MKAAWTDFYRQLKNRRVIRTAVVYAAVVWGALQLADLLAESGFIAESLVRGLIFAALVGFPVTLVLSWSFEAPWRKRRGLAVVGDLAVILAIAVGVFLLAWQQYFTSFARPALAILRIEPTDARPDTGMIGDHIAARLRMVLATRTEIMVTELSSSQQAGVLSMPPAEKARALKADYLLGGTINQTDEEVRLNLQLFDSGGKLLWSAQFGDRLLDQAQLQSRVLNELWTQLPLPADALVTAREIISACNYPPDPEAVLAIISAKSKSADQAVESLNGFIGRHEHNGLLRLARAKANLRRIQDLPPPRRPVVLNLALQDLRQLAEDCSGHPETKLLELRNNRVLEDPQTNYETYLAGFPNDAGIRRTIAGTLLNAGQVSLATTLAREAWQLDPLSQDSICLYGRVLSETGEGDADAAFITHLQRFSPGLSGACW